MVDFVVPIDIRIKIKESKKRDKYVDLARRILKKTVKPILVCTLWTIPK